MLRTVPFAAVLIAAPAAAGVVQSSTVGFEVSNTVTVAAPPDKAWPTVVAPRLWWDKDHTYSEDAGNLSLDERPGGCFCEKLPGRGGVEHMRVVYIQPPLMIRMTGGLGPLQAEGATGTLAITLSPDGAATKIVMSYVAGGYIRGGAEKLAPLVDRVLGQQLARLKAAIEGVTPAPAIAAPQIRDESLADVRKTISDLGGEPTPAAAQDAPVPVPAPKPKPRPADQDSPR